MKPIMWMGRVRGVAAFGMGALFIGSAVLQLSWSVFSWQLILAGALLMIGSFRTLTGMSGGLRLLCGAWGFSAGLSLAPMSNVLEPATSGYQMVDTIADLMVLVVPIVSLIGLALTVLHKERK